MRRRQMFIGAAAAAVGAVALPALPSASPTVIAATVDDGFVWDGEEWLSILKRLGYDLRKQYVANLRTLTPQQFGDHPDIDKFIHLVDLIEELNERGAFGWTPEPIGYTAP